MPNHREARIFAVVPAAGVGRRMGGEVPKQYLEIAGKRVLEHTLERFLDHPAIVAVAVAVSAQDPYWPEVAARYPGGRLLTATGGAERCHSVLSGLGLLLGRARPEDWVMVHDAARPCLSAAEIDGLLRELADDPVGGILAVPVRDTLKRAAESAHGRNRVAATVDRAGLWQALTPQMFRLGPLIAAIEAAIARGILVTDEAQAMELAGLTPRLVAGSVRNIKITLPEDRALAELYLRDRRVSGVAAS
jgi:2-C-methyl-D-erythritol 4-phosphate cytidylyltransferase